MFYRHCWSIFPHMLILKYVIVDKYLISDSKCLRKYWMNDLYMASPSGWILLDGCFSPERPGCHCHTAYDVHEHCWHLQSKLQIQIYITVAQWSRCQLPIYIYICKSKCAVYTYILIHIYIYIYIHILLYIHRYVHIYRYCI